MQIITWYGRQSKAVENYASIEAMAADLKNVADNGPFPSNKNIGCFALHHSQVSEEPYNFFVLSKKGMEMMPEEFKDQFIFINPKIIQKGEDIFEACEGCISFGFRQHTRVKRYRTVVVETELPNGEKKRQQLADLASEIFQHEIDHGKGISIYDRK